MRNARLPWVVAITALALAATARAQVPLLATEQAKLTANNAAAYDWLGLRVAVDGDTAAAVAPDAGLGATYVYVRSGTLWTQQAQLTAGGGAYDSGVAIDGDTVAVGRISNTGFVNVFERSGTTWTHQAQLKMTGAKLFDNFGEAVALDGDTLVAGAPSDDTGAGADAGSAVVFVRSGTTWTQQKKLKASDEAPGNYFGSSVALMGDTAIVGAPFNGGGAAYVFVRSGTTWTEQAALSAPGLLSNEWLGTSVAIFGDTAAVGAPFWDVAKIGSYSEGSVFVYERSGTTWGVPQRFQASDASSLDEFGRSVSLGADTLAVGAPYNDLFLAGWDAGSAYVFERAGTTWSEAAKLKASDGRTDDFLGWSVALSGETVVAGAFSDRYAGLVDAGSVYVFELSHPPVSYCTAGVSAAGCTAAVGASGVASASAASGFLVTAAGAEGGRTGLFYYGTGGRQASPWGNGTSLQCVVPPVRRGGVLAGGGSAGVCDGSFSLDLNARWCPTCPRPGHNPGAGTTGQVQLWYRDPFNTSNQTTTLSDALEYLVAP
jgi:hypothetical protein